MKIPFPLTNLLQASDAELPSMIQLISLGTAFIDCTNYEAIADEDLERLLALLPETWGIEEIAEAFSGNALNEVLGEQIANKLGNGEKSTPHSRTDTEPASPTVSKPTPSYGLDVFKLRNEIINDYRSYITSFLQIKDERVEQFVQEKLDQGSLWKDSLVQINPSYKKGQTVQQLIDENLLHTDCQNYFKSNFNFHYHQEQAFRAYHANLPYVLTTGTGSGKSLSYVVPIIDDLSRNPQIKGVRAILVYPMNALINSQEGEFNKFFKQYQELTGKKSPITVAKYTGQEKLDEKINLQNNPPHILLTNYVMLELMLSRRDEAKFVESQDLQFVVLDELHTYRGRQGADVAMVIRKLRQRCNRHFLCIGTSATMATEGTRGDRRQTVANVASKLFGTAINPEQVIDETLERAITRPYPEVDELRESLQQLLPADGDKTEFLAHPLSAWVEMNFGLKEEEGRLERQTPMGLEAGAERLAQLTDIEPQHCREQLQAVLLWGSRTEGLAFRLHQFISQGGSVYATLEHPDRRHLTLDGQYKIEGERLLYPLVFCRECGQDYYLVKYDQYRQHFSPRLPSGYEEDGEDQQSGYLALNEPEIWQEEDAERLPDAWFKVTKRRGREPRPNHEKYIPQKFWIRPNGEIFTGALVEGSQEAVSAWFIPKPFQVCLNCGVVHHPRKNEYAKLSRLSSEGRSTATTLLCLATVSRLKTEASVSETARKILSFTDNRQDASLQAG
ncbi:MAG: DEAD/DEAH box helicase, partial [Snowella sp.]|nr:DEAD/DEAH box helicase [Snowella sp.]